MYVCMYVWKAIAGLKWSNGILLAAFNIIRRWFRHYMRFFRQYTRWFEPIIRGAFAIIPPGAFTITRGAFTILIYGGGFAIIRSASSIIRGAFNIIRGAFNIIRDAFIQQYFHILSCIWFHDCLNLVCGWQCFLIFASGLQWQWHALKRFIYALCEFYILSYSFDLLVINTIL
jgi:hypothetical protein